MNEAASFATNAGQASRPAAMHKQGTESAGRFGMTMSWDDGIPGRGQRRLAGLLPADDAGISRGES
jgi:hypothetical protein